MNVAPDVYAKGSWVVHLYADTGDEHIYQLKAVSATNAARIALEGYEADRRASSMPDPVNWNDYAIDNVYAIDQQWR